MGIHKIEVTNKKGEVLNMTFESKEAQGRAIWHLERNGIDYKASEHGFKSYNMRNVAEAFDDIDYWVAA